MTIPDKFEEQFLICQFMGCEVYEGFRTPISVNYTVSGQMVEDFRKRGFKTGGFEKQMMFENLQFHKSWDWLMIVWKQFLYRLDMADIHFGMPDGEKVIDIRLVNDWNHATFSAETLNGFSVVVNAITLFNKKIKL